MNPNFSNKLPPQFIWENISNRTFTDQLRTPNIQRKFQNFMNTDHPRNDTGITQCLNEFQDILIEAGNKSLKIKKVKKRKKVTTVSNKKWFDKECLLKRHEVRKLANQKHRDPMNENLRIRYHNELKVYKSILKSKKEKFQSEKLVDLENAAQNDPNSFWKILKTIDDETPNSSGSNVISEEQWLSYFQTLHSRHELK